MPQKKVHSCHKSYWLPPRARHLPTFINLIHYTSTSTSSSTISKYPINIPTYEPCLIRTASSLPTPPPNRPPSSQTPTKPPYAATRLSHHHRLTTPAQTTITCRSAAPPPSHHLLTTPFQLHPQTTNPSNATARREASNTEVLTIVVEKPQRKPRGWYSHGCSCWVFSCLSSTLGR